jgi:hypothetical protein
MERIEKGEDIIDFIVVLASFIPNKMWERDDIEIKNLATGKSYRTLKNFYKTRFKELFNMEIEYE